MIFVDSNIPMYLVGVDHPHKVDAQIQLERLILQRTSLFSDAGVIQEILHRYSAIGRRDAIQPAIASLQAIVDEILPVTVADVLAARDLLMESSSLSARDALHVAVMRQHGIPQILSFDRGFDAVPGISRIH